MCQTCEKLHHPLHQAATLGELFHFVALVQLPVLRSLYCPHTCLSNLYIVLPVIAIFACPTCACNHCSSLIVPAIFVLSYLFSVLPVVVVFVLAATLQHGGWTKPKGGPDNLPWFPPSLAAPSAEK